MGTVPAWRQDKDSDFSVPLEKRVFWLEMLRGEEREERMQRQESTQLAGQRDCFLLQDLLLHFSGCVPACRGQQITPISPIPLAGAVAARVPQAAQQSPGHRFHSCRRSYPAADMGFAGYRLEPDTGGSSAHLRRAQHHLGQDCLGPAAPEDARVPGPRAEGCLWGRSAARCSRRVGFLLNLSSGDL